MTVIPILGRLRREDSYEFEASLVFVVSAIKP